MARAAIEERETLLNLNAADRVNGGTWLVFSDDPAMITKLRRVAQPHKNNGQGGYWFSLPLECVSFRKPTKNGHRKPPTKRVRSQNSPLQGDLEGKQPILVIE